MNFFSLIKKEVVQTLGVGGKTAKIKFSNLKASFGDIGKQGDKGEKGQTEFRGIDGTGTQYWTQSPSDGDAVYYDTETSESEQIH